MTGLRKHVALYLTSCLVASVEAGCGLDTTGMGIPANTAEDSEPEGTGPALTPRGEIVRDGGEGVREADRPSSHEPEDTMAPEAGMGCDFPGRYAMQMSALVTWGGKTLLGGLVPLLDEGAGTMDLTVMVDLEEDASGLVGELRPCDANIPVFRAESRDERYQMYFEPQSWQSPHIPRAPLRAVTSCSQAGCEIHIREVYVLVGAHMAPHDGPWPSERTSIEYRDHDRDSLQGFTVRARGPGEDGRGYEYPPVEFKLLNPRRADAMGLAIRTAATVSGRFVSCDTLRGVASEMTIETHAADCHIAGRESDRCTADELQFVDDHLPRWTVQSAIFRASKIPNDSDCDAVRAAVSGP